MRKKLIGLCSADIIHTKDKSYQDNLSKILGFKKLVQNTVGTIMEKYAAVEYSGNGISINAVSSPKLNSALNDAKKTLDIKDTISFSTDWHYAINSFTVGEQKKRIVLLTGTVDLLNDIELQFILGHELGHIKCNHITYQMLAESLFIPIQDSVFKFAISAVRIPLLNWYRISDFTADRAGLLCCQDITVALQTMIKMAGLPKSYYSQIDIKTFIEQARSFQKNTDIVDKAIKYLSVNSAFHPWLILRAAELLEWYESGQYSKIINLYGKDKEFSLRY